MVIAALAGWLLPAPAPAADAYPSATIKIVVPFSPGAADAQLRALIPALMARLGQSVVILNAPGGGGIVSGGGVGHRTSEHS